MAGFEVIVRPAVFPNIRPAPPRVLPPEDDPTQGICVIGGSGGRLIDLPHSWSVSVSRQKPHTEAARQFDKERVHQVDENGKVNKKNYVDLERLKKVRFDTEEGPYKVIYADPPLPPPPENSIEILERDRIRRAPIRDPGGLDQG